MFSGNFHEDGTNGFNIYGLGCLYMCSLDVTWEHSCPLKVRWDYCECLFSLTLSSPQNHPSKSRGG